ncbi:MAG: hypothetical protein DCF32_17170 [Leptolyngbya sp.]|nr:MAG: hypothetical protein DCF32_17170 [Leptolyngbya sp.]
MIPSPDNEKAIAIAITLLKRKSPQNIQTLKNLLTFIPNPNHINTVLAIAVMRLIYICPKSAFWLFENPQLLEPEVNVRAIIIRELMPKVLSWGYPKENFHITDDYRLDVSDDTKHALLLHRPEPADESMFMLLCALLSEHDRLSV